MHICTMFPTASSFTSTSFPCLEVKSCLKMYSMMHLFVELIACNRISMRVRACACACACVRVGVYACVLVCAQVRVWACSHVGASISALKPAPLLH